MDITHPAVQAGISTGISLGFTILKMFAPSIPSFLGVPINIALSTALAYASGHPSYEQVMAVSGGSALLHDVVKNYGSGNHPIGEKKDKE